jgi:hypothetical protein
MSSLTATSNVISNHPDQTYGSPLNKGSQQILGSLHGTIADSQPNEFRRRSAQQTPLLEV